MSANELSNKRITNISVLNNSYVIHVPLHNDYVNKSEIYYFALTHRYGEELIECSSSIQSKQGDYTIINVSFSFEDNIELFLKNEIWDLNLFKEKNDELLKLRVESNYDNLRFNTIILEEKEKIFYPFTTKEGNVSFRINEYQMFGTFEEVYLETNKLIFSGNYNYPPLFHSHEYVVKDVKVIVTNNIDEQEIEVSIQQNLRDDLYDKYNGNEMLKYAGFKGEFNFLPYVILNQNKYYKFYVELTYEKDGAIHSIRSTRVRIDHFANSAQKKIVNYNERKFKVKVKPTKKSKYLSLQISDYKIKKEVFRKLKSGWIRLRRSNALQELYKYAFVVLGKLPVKQNLIMFESFLGKQYSDSPRAIYEYLLQHKPSYEMYWSVDRRQLKFFEDKNVKYVRRFSIKWLFLMARAGYWVSNSRLPLWIPKPKHTKYLQTWHGTPLKRLAADMDEVHMPGTNTIKYKQNFLKESSKWDYLVSPNAYSTEIFKRAFQFDKQMIESGYPRNDFLINSNNSETISKIKKSINLPGDKKVILYAPTWRDNQFYARGKYKFNLELDLERLKQEFEDEYIIVLRLHYLVAENLDLSGFEGFVYDLSHHEDIRELYLISDLLITDYSSVFFDYANLKRPILFYVYDIEDYRDNLRGFYFDFEEKAPGPLVRTTEEAISAIKEIDYNGFKPSETTDAFYKKFCYLEDGHASKRVVEKVFQK
ncbi:CDP-glycerol:poly(glycerophosphate) glycerophosphotransferase [Virgibacillus subterraneus]|uniref:CDP-glycerol:poly(Glycerophosphate) glycerophosphotransferase n=1 Tax=Virgibacillus subterraneus TaxID=621109 RepID=A0A1H9AF82_9BACI|nr:CDP-glycerol glycerophosphotransferase family protein [Virgibacillus subterraneus]SEP75350.1 CDP-glycerol:poly(glycerophosphate) glycerophosphotransferase [Virgibacillus subterraneus]